MGILTLVYLSKAKHMVKAFIAGIMERSMTVSGI